LLKPGSRVAQYIELLQTMPRTIAPDPEIGRRAMALTEGAVIGDIFEQLAVFQRSPNWRHHFELLMDGHFWPDGEDDRARAKQLELWLAARAARAGLGVELGNPDVLLTDAEGSFVVEAKRAQNSKKLERHIKKGVEQILDSGHPGIVALDVSRLLDLHMCAVSANSYEEADQIIYGRIKSLTSNGEFQKWVRQKDPHGKVLAMLSTVFTAVIFNQTAGIVALRKIVGGPVDPWDPRGMELFRRLVGRLARQI
jgi:hypothetical protein